MLSAEELTRIVEEGDRGEKDQLYAITLDDGDALFAVAETLTPLAAQQSGVPVDVSALEQLAEWLEGTLTALDPAAPDAARALAATFAPFLSAAQTAAYLDDPADPFGMAASRDIATAAGYADAISATWGPVVAQIARTVAPAASPQARTRLEREMLAVCGACSVPIALALFSLEGSSAYEALAGFALALEELHRRLAPGVMQTHAELDRLVRRKLAQLQAVNADITPGEPPSANGSRPDRFAAIGYVGALLELRGECLELGEELGRTSASRRKFVSPASKMGIVDPLIIDQGPRLKKLQDLQPKVNDWITEALTVAARDPTNAGLDHMVDRIAVTIGAIHSSLALIRITEALIDADNPDLWKQVEPWAHEIERSLEFFEADVAFEDWKRIVANQAEEAALLVKSYQWSRIVLQAMLDATDVILAIETGKTMGGVGPSLRTQLASAGVVRSGGAALSAAELERLLAGSAIVAMAAAKSKKDPAKSRRKGIKSEIGQGLPPDRPRIDVGSITGTASARYPDRVLFRFRTFWELKNVLNLRLTRQLTDFMLYAQATGMKMVLYIRPTIKGASKAGTKLSPSLRDAIKILKREGLIEIRYLKVY